MIEEAFFFDHEKSQIFAMLHRPAAAGAAGANGGRGFVFCPAFADEDFRTHREMVVYARRLAAEGFHVLRFDYRGCGDSGGRFEDFTLAARRADIRRAIDVLQEKSGVGWIGLLGIRFGANLAAGVAAEDDRVSCLILWAPVVPVGQYVKILQMSQMTHELAHFGRVVSNRKLVADLLAAGGSLDVSGNLITSRVYKELQGFDPWAAPGRHPRQVLILGVDGDTSKPADLEQLRQHYPQAEVVIIKEKLFWFDKLYQNPAALYDTTSAWLRKAVGRPQP